MFNALISPEIRAYARVAPFIAFMCLLFSATLISAVTTKMPKAGAYLVWSAVVLIGLFDQSNFKLLRELRAESKMIVEDVAPVVSALERRLPPSAAVFQLPYTEYPHTPPMFVGMSSQEHLLGYVLSHRLRWSWPSLSADAVRRQEILQALSYGDLSEILPQLGYQAVWINRTGYADGGIGITKAFVMAGATPIVEDARKRLIALALPSPPRTADLAKATGTGERVIYPGETVSFARSGPGTAFIRLGWSDPEVGFCWTVGERAELEINLGAAKQGPYALELSGMAFVSAQKPNMTMSVTVNGREVGKRLFVAGGAESPTRLPLPLDGDRGTNRVRISLLFDDVRSPKELGVSADSRRLGFALQSLRIVGVQEPP